MNENMMTDNKHTFRYNTLKRIEGRPVASVGLRGAEA